MGSTYFFDNDSAKAMSNEYQGTIKHSFSAQRKQEVLAMREDAVLVSRIIHVLCDLGVVSVHENARIWAFPGEQIGRPENRFEFATTAFRRLSKGWPCLGFQHNLL
jgi:hypothetical protein